MSASFNQLETPRLRLRRFTDADLPTLLAYRNDPEIARYQSWMATTPKAIQAFIDELKLLEPGTPGEWFQVAIELTATNTHIGDCALYVQADDPHHGEIGYTLARAYHRQGYATEAVQGLLRYVFATLNLHRVTASVDCENTRSVAVLERVGMRREGHFRQQVWIKGQQCDEYLYAITHEDWQAGEG